MRADQVQGLMEAYSQVYETPKLSDEEIFEDWVYSFVEEGYDLSKLSFDSFNEKILDEALGSEFVQRGGVQGAIQRAQARAAKDGGASNRAWLGNKVKGFFDAQSSFVQRGGVQGAIQRAQARAAKDGGASNRAWLARQLGLGGNQPTKTQNPKTQNPNNKGDNQPLAKTTPSAVSVKNLAGQSQQVTAGRNYAAKLGGKDVNVSYDASGKRTVSQVAPKPSPTTSPSTTSPSATSSSAPKPPSPALGTLGKTSFERRTPTSAELRAAQQARASGANPEQALQAAQKTNLPTTGPTPAIPDVKSVNQSLAAANAPANLNKPAPAGTALAAQQAQQKKNPPPTTMKQSYEWPSGKTIKDLANAYSSIYEAKKKIDQDQDGDNDFADVRIARMVASGVPKEVAIAKTKSKPYNKEEFELGEATAMAKRGYDEAPIRQKIAASTGGGAAADRATALADRPSFGSPKRQKQRENLARAQRGDFRKTTSSNPGLHGYAHKSDDPAVKAKQAARGAQRGRLTPAEKQKLGEDYQIVASYLLENNFAETIESANAIIESMSETWINEILNDN